MEPGLYRVHKSAGAPSSDWVRTFQREAEAAGARLKICHGGALDPFAEGLLLILVGQATRLMDLLHPVPKVYVAEVNWGVETDNGDPLGRVLHQGDPSTLTPARLDSALAAFLGWTDQVPPATSNKRVGGERAYVLAHRGQEVELPPSRVYLHSARWLTHDLPGRSELELVCRGGYYVRALARDLGRNLGCFAHLRSLRRTAIGPWGDVPPEARAHVRGPGLLPWCPTRLLSDAEVGALRRGEAVAAHPQQPAAWTLPARFPDPQGPVLGVHLGRLASLLRPDGADLRMALELRHGL